MDVRLPQVQITEGAAADDPPEIELDDDPDVAAALDTSNVPLLITVAQVGPAASAWCTWGGLSLQSWSDSSLWGPRTAQPPSWPAGSTLEGRCVCGRVLPAAAGLWPVQGAHACAGPHLALVHVLACSWRQAS